MALLLTSSSVSLLTHFMPLVSLYTPWKHQKTSGFLIFLGGIEREHWQHISYQERLYLTLNKYLPAGNFIFQKFTLLKKIVILCLSPHFILKLQSLKLLQSRIQDSVKHLRWSSLQKAPSFIFEVILNTPLLLMIPRVFSNWEFNSFMTEVPIYSNLYMCKSMDWFLYDRDLRYERVNGLIETKLRSQSPKNQKTIIIQQKQN